MSSRLTILLFAMLSVPAFAQKETDTVQLKDGNSKKGQIQAEDFRMVKIAGEEIPWSKVDRVIYSDAPSELQQATDALVFLADVIQVSRGGWFETYDEHPGAGAAATPGAIAANIGFVVATEAGSAAADAAGRPGAFDDGWNAERGRQLAWLTERLDLEEL